MSFFTLIARNLCNVFKDSAFSQILVSRAKKDCALHAVDTSFVCDELAKLKLSKVTGLDKIPARLLKDAASVIAKPVTYLINLTISTGEIPSQWKEARVTPIYKTGKKDDGLVSLVFKVMECAIQVQLLSFLDENKVLSVF